jgi:predicted phosphodiesterase
MPRTTRIAILSDIHGNMPALKAVLADIDSQDIDEVLVGGDMVGRGPEGSKVVALVRERGLNSVRGNHEDYMLGFRRRTVPEEWLESEEWAASRWMAAELHDGDDEYLDALPFSLAATAAPGLRLVHGSPGSHGEGLGPWCTDGQLEQQLGAVDEKLLVCAHTHRPMYRRTSGGQVVNVGAVGLPFNKDQRAQYAILHHHPRDGWHAEFRRVSYDIESILSIYDTSGFLEAGGVTAQLLRLELQYAAPFLVPFTHWARIKAIPPEPAHLVEFLDFYDSDEPTQTFIDRLRAL